MRENDLVEGSIILQCQKGDKEMYGRLVKKYMQRAYYVALGLVGSHDGALDLSQEAFVRAYRSIQKLNPEGKFYTWYYQILRNLCFNYLRDNARHAHSFSEIGEQRINQIVDDSEDASLKVEKDEMCEQLWNAIDALKPNEREIIILKDFQEMSYKEIAATLECPIGTVMSRLYTARQALKLKMESYLNA
ncbi:MAG TPA: sigma-70 family RNA polymerase sigma factor [bacterium]